jgi:transposase
MTISELSILSHKATVVVPRKTWEELTSRLALLEAENRYLRERLQLLEEQLRLSKHREFGVSSEKTTVDVWGCPETSPQHVFNEPEMDADATIKEPEIEEVAKRSHQQNRGKRRQGLKAARLANLSMETIEYKLPEHEQICAACQGQLHQMSSRIREEIEFVPASFKRVQHVQHIYSCRNCEKNGQDNPVSAAPVPNPVIRNSIASPSLIAHCCVQKFSNHTPIYRLAQQLELAGLSLCRQTICNWIIMCSNILLVLYNRMKDHLIAREILYADESTLQVLHEPDRAPITKSYMWLYRTDPKEIQIILYEYQTTRSGKHPQEFLKGFRGYLHVDGYSGYNFVENITRVGCWAHARRKFKDAQKARQTHDPNLAQAIRKALVYIRQLYELEKEAKDLNNEQRYQLRQTKSKPVLMSFFEWLREELPHEVQFEERSVFQAAINYCLNQKERLEAYLLDGRLSIDNNLSERSIKPFVMGRKNWLFANVPAGAKASAIVYSILETAKANGLRPQEYMTHLLITLPNIDTTDMSELDKLLPFSTTLPAICYKKPNH